MKIVRPLLLVFSPVYWLITAVRNALFNVGVLRSKAFKIPIIAIGNLSAGGTGKTPHTEFVARFVSEKLNLHTAILSRGYGRLSSRIQVVEESSLPLIVGDEPVQLKKRLPHCEVVVDGNRVRAINTMLSWPTPPQVVVLDDAFQHRRLKAGQYILLTSFSHLFVDDVLLPGGNLREARTGAKRAHAIVVTKCPYDLSAEQQQAMSKRIQQYAHQHIFFTTLRYDKPITKHGRFNFNQPFVLVTGIAQDEPMVRYLIDCGKEFYHFRFPDHHEFTQKDIDQIVARAKAMGGQLLTTEKDFQRFDENIFRDEKLNVAYLPISIHFLNKKDEFESFIADYTKQF